MKEKVVPININLGNIFSEEYIDSYNDIATTYLGLENMPINDTFNLEESFPFYANSHTLANYKTGGVMDILLYSGVLKLTHQNSFI